MAWLRVSMSLLMLCLLPAALLAQEPTLTTPVGHANDVEQMQFSPDGSRLVTAANSEIFIWEVASGRCISNLVDARLGVTQKLAFSADGMRLAAATAAGLLIFDLTTGALVNNLPVPNYTANYLVFSPDGAMLAISDGSEIALWTIATAKKEKTISMRPALLGPMAFKAADRLEIITRDNTAKTVARRVWNPATATEVMEAASAPIPCERFVWRLSPDGTRLLLEHDDQSSLLDMATGNAVGTAPPLLLKSQQVAISAEGRFIAMQYAEEAEDTERYNGLLVWDTLTNTAVFSRKPITLDPDAVQPAPYSALALSPDGSILFAANGKLVNGWDTRGGQAREALGANSRQWNVTGLQWQGDSLLLAKAGKELLRLPIEGEAPMEAVDSQISLRKFLPLPNVKQLIGQVFFQNKYVLIESAGEKVLQEYLVPAGTTISDFAVSPDGRLLAGTALRGTKGADNKTTYTMINLLWEVEKGILLHQREQPYISLDELEFSADGKSLVALGAKAMLVWEVGNDSLSMPRAIDLPATTLNMLPCDYNPKSGLAAYGTADKLAIWDVAAGTNIRVLPPLTAKIGKVAFSPDGAWLAVALEGNRLQLVETATWTVKYDFSQQQSGYTDAIAFSPDSKILVVTTRADARFWDLAEGKILGMLIAFEPNEWIAYGVDGKFDASPDMMKRLYWRTGMKVEDLSVHLTGARDAGLLKKLVGN